MTISSCLGFPQRMKYLISVVFNCWVKTVSPPSETSPFDSESDGTIDPFTVSKSRRFLNPYKLFSLPGHIKRHASVRELY